MEMFTEVSFVYNLRVIVLVNLSYERARLADVFSAKPITNNSAFPLMVFFFQLLFIESY